MRYAGSGVDRPASLCDLLRVGLDANPDGVALISADTRWTWRTLDRLSGRLAESLLGLGLKPGDRVASLMPNRPALVVHYLACFKAGLVATPLNYRYMGPEIDHALEISNARVLLAHVEREEDLVASERAGRLPLGRISYGAKGRSGLTFEDLVQGEPAVAAADGPLPIGAGRDLLHLGQYRTPEGGHSHA